MGAGGGREKRNAHRIFGYKLEKGNHSKHLCIDGRKQSRERQCMCNVTLRGVGVTTVEVGKHKYYLFCVCVCSVRYPACKTQASCHLWPVRH